MPNTKPTVSPTIGIPPPTPGVRVVQTNFGPMTDDVTVSIGGTNPVHIHSPNFPTLPILS